MMKEAKKDSFFHKFIDSIKNIEKYPELAIKSYGEVLLYMVKLLLIFALIISIAYTCKISLELNEVTNFIYNELPDFSMQDGFLFVKDNKILVKENITENLNIVIMDSNNIEEDTLEKYKSNLLDKENGIILLKDKLLFKTMATDGIQEFKYSELVELTNINSFTKQDLNNYLSGKNIVLIYLAIFVTSYIYIFIFYSISILLDIILLCILGYISTLFMRMRIRFNALCKMAIHSLTLPILLNIVVILIQLFTPFRVKYFELMYIIIAYIYMIAAISIIRIDIIKNKQELLNIMEEQKRVKEELDRQEEEEKRKQKEKEEKKEENEKEKENKKEEKEDPQGEGT